jgi:hypothetical protein
LLEDDGLEIRVYARGVRVFAYAVEKEALLFLKKKKGKNFCYWGSLELW